MRRGHAGTVWQRWYEVIRKSMGSGSQTRACDQKGMYGVSGRVHLRQISPRASKAQRATHLKKDEEEGAPSHHEAPPSPYPRLKWRDKSLGMPKKYVSRARRPGPATDLAARGGDLRGLAERRR